jgi:hypothetical protein
MNNYHPTEFIVPKWGEQSDRAVRSQTNLTLSSTGADASDSFKYQVRGLLDDLATNWSPNAGFIEFILRRVQSEMGDFEYFKHRSVQFTRLRKHRDAWEWSRKAVSSAQNEAERGEALANIADDYLSVDYFEEALRLARISLEIAPTPQGFINSFCSELGLNRHSQANDIIMEGCLTDGAIRDGIVEYFVAVPTALRPPRITELLGLALR